MVGPVQTVRRHFQNEYKLMYDIKESITCLVKSTLRNKMRTKIYTYMIFGAWKLTCLIALKPKELINSGQRKKNCLFLSEHPSEIFFLTMRPIIFFRNKWIKKIWKQKMKTDTKKEKWDQLKKKNAWTFFFVKFLYLHL